MLHDIIPVFLTKDKLTPTSSAAWDIKGRLEDMEQSYSKLRSDFASADKSKNAMEEKCELYKTRGKVDNNVSTQSDSNLHL